MGGQDPKPRFMLSHLSGIGTSAEVFLADVVDMLDKMQSCR